MRHQWRSAVGRVVVSVLLVGVCSAWAQSDAQTALDRFKSMAGTWTGTGAKGETAEVTYKVMAGGTSVENE